MKKLFAALLCLLLAGLCACGQATSPEETTTVVERPTWLAADAHTAFSSIIEDALNQPKGYDTLKDFILYDTGCESAPALLAGVDNFNGYIHEIYTFQNGAAKQVLCIDYETGDCYINILKTGIIKTGSFGVSTNSYYRFDEEGQLKLIMKLDSYGDYRGLFRVDPTGEKKDFDFYFTPDGTEVHISQKKFERLKEEIEGDGEVVDLDWKPLAEYGR